MRELMRGVDISAPLKNVETLIAMERQWEKVANDTFLPIPTPTDNICFYSITLSETPDGTHIAVHIDPALRGTQRIIAATRLHNHLKNTFTRLKYKAEAYTGDPTPRNSISGYMAFSEITYADGQVSAAHFGNPSSKGLNEMVSQPSALAIAEECAATRETVFAGQHTQVAIDKIIQSRILLLFWDGSDWKEQLNNTIGMSQSPNAGGAMPGAPKYDVAIRFPHGRWNFLSCNSEAEARAQILDMIKGGSVELIPGECTAIAIHVHTAERVQQLPIEQVSSTPMFHEVE